MTFHKYSLMVIAGLMVSVQTQGLELQCEEHPEKAQTLSIPTGKPGRFELTDNFQCRWTAPDEALTASLLFKAPRSSEPTEIEIATYLDAKDSTATHIALLDDDYEPVKWIPFSAFRERKRYMTARFFLNPSDEVHYILVGGAHKASEQSLSRTYSPTSTNILNIAGLVTARELSAEFNFVPSGKIRIRIRKPRSNRIDIAQ